MKTVFALILMSSTAFAGETVIVTACPFDSTSCYRESRPIIDVPLRAPKSAEEREQDRKDMEAGNRAAQLSLNRQLALMNRAARAVDERNRRIDSEAEQRAAANQARIDAEVRQSPIDLVKLRALQDDVRAMGR